MAAARFHLDNWMKNIAFFAHEADLFAGGAALKLYEDYTGCVIIKETVRSQKDRLSAPAGNRFYSS